MHPSTPVCEVALIRPRADPYPCSGGRWEVVRCDALTGIGRVTASLVLDAPLWQPRFGPV